MSGVGIALPVVTDEGIKIHVVLDPSQLPDLEDAIVGISGFFQYDSIKMLLGIVPAISEMMREDNEDRNR